MIPRAPSRDMLLQRLQAMGEETRLDILQRLAAADGELCVCELQSELAAAQSRLSFHLKKLRDVGLVRDRRDGRWVYYSIVPEALDEMREALGGLGTADVWRTSTPGPSCCG